MITPAMLHPSDTGDELSADILQLVLDNLVGGTKTLAHAGLVCRSWRALSLPSLLKDVDLSSHNNGCLPDYEGPFFALTHQVATIDYR